MISACVGMAAATCTAAAEEPIPTHLMDDVPPCTRCRYMGPAKRIIPGLDLDDDHVVAGIDRVRRRPRWDVEVGS
jgi:hypothetical protein